MEGANGSGKTTLLRILAGLFTDYSGQVTGADLPCRYLGHRSGVRGGLTALENLRWLVQLSELPAAEVELLAALEAIGLAGYEDTFCGELSEGQAKRVALARLLLPGGGLWLLDEPFSAIDVAGIPRLTGAIEQHSATGGVVVMTSHQPVELATPIRRVRL